MPTTKILVLAMSLRKDSLNKKFAKNAHRLLTAAGADAELLQLNDFPMPVYDGDLEAAGMPAGVKALGDKISGAAAIVISTPEYNGGMPGPFKNAFDWVTRIKPTPWTGKHILLLGASPGALGAVRGLWHSRQPLEATGCYVFPEMMGLPLAGDAFSAEDQFKEAKNEERLGKLLKSFTAHALK